MKKYILHILSIILLFSLPQNSRAQHDYTFELITIDSRANFGDVHTLYQDSAGVIWMGIYGKGLAYYNGKEIHRLPLPDEGNFSQNNDVFVASEDLIFLNYGNSVKVFDPIQQEIIQVITLPVAEAESKKIRTIAVTRKGDDLLVWATVGSMEKEADKSSSFRLWLSKNKEPFTEISTQDFSTRGEATIKGIGSNVLLKVATGFLQINELGEKIKTYPFPEENLAGVNTFNLKVEDNQDFWFSSSCEYQDKGMQGKIFICDVIHWKKGAASPDYIPLPWNYFYNVVRAKNEKTHLKVLNKIGDLLFLDDEKLYNVATQKMEEINAVSIHTAGDGVGVESVGRIFTLLKDNTGVVWMGGTYGLGKMVHQAKAFKLLPVISLRSFIEGDDGMIYGSVDWAEVIKPGTLPRHNIRMYDPATNHVNDLDLDSWWHQAVFYKGSIYYRQVAIDLETKKLQPTALSGNPYNAQMTLLDRKERFWLIGWGEHEIEIFDPESSTIIKKTIIPALKEKPVEINDWYQRPSDGTVWMGTYGQGIFIFSEEGDLTTHLHTSGNSPLVLNNNVVSGFYEDSKGFIWIGHGKGLSRISADLSGIDHFYIDEKQPELRLVYSILPEDNDRYLWLSTSKGIFRFDTETGDFFDFPLHPVIMDAEYNRTSFYKAKSGQMFFGADNSNLPTVSFFPEQVMDFYRNIEWTKLGITLDNYIRFDGKNESVITRTTGLQALDEIVLHPGDRYFSLEFFATDYRSPKDNHYSFYLDGYEKDWNEAARNNNEVRYENLPPGDYTLKMRGALMPENMALNERQLTVRVLPYWYQTWWSKILFLLLIGAGFYLFYKIKTTRQFEMQEATRLRDIDNLKTRLYTNITHEFRTPLTVIMGMNDNIKGYDQERGLIKRNAENLLRLINQLLDLSKLDSGTLTLDAVQGDIISYLQYLTESFYAMASDNKVKLSFKPEKPSLIMDFDEGKIQHVVYNLLSNAIKFTRPGGKVVLETGHTKNNGAEYLSIKIKDTGVGIPPKDLPFIFDRFYQAEMAGVTPVKTFAGTGIGLALTKEMIELMGGQVTVKSEVDWGTEFEVLLPIKRSLITPKLESEYQVKLPDPILTPDVEELQKEPDQIQSDKPQVLLIEDNAGVVTYIQSLLQNDYDIKVAINGQEGIDMALEHIPDLIITDVMMPEKNGYEVCQLLKTDERTSHIPIVILTAKADMSSKIEGLEVGADAYLSKPFEKEELLVRLRKLLELRQQLQLRYSNHSQKFTSEIKVETPDPEAITEPTIEDLFLEKLTAVITDRMDNPELSIPDVCQAIQLSHTQLYRKLKALTGKTPSQFIRSIRLAKAKELLKNANLNISEVAYDVGFNDPNYFTRMFKEEFGKVPGDFRG